jgi:hypothetical protein
MDHAWSYGDIEMIYTTPDEERLHLFTWLFFMLALVAAPLSASTIALVRFWPMSGVVWVLAGVAFWTAVFATAADEDS